MKKFGEKLRILRKRRGLTLRQLGSMLDVHYTHVGRIENGLKPSVDLILKIADIFDVCIDKLMRDELELDDWPS